MPDVVDDPKIARSRGILPGIEPNGIDDPKIARTAKARPKYETTVRWKRPSRIAPDVRATAPQRRGTDFPGTGGARPTPVDRGLANAIPPGDRAAKRPAMTGRRPPPRKRLPGPKRKAETLRSKHLRNEVLVTNYPKDAPKHLSAQGFKFVGTLGNTEVQIWVHPSGDEVWWVPPTKVVVPAARPEDPAVTQARVLADESSTTRDRIARLVRELKASIGRSNYSRLARQFWDEFQKWQDDLNWMMEDALPPLKEEVNAVDRDAVEAQMARVKELDNWKRTQFPELVRELPPP